MVLKKCERLVAIASANFPDDLLKDILVPALSFADPDNYWQQATSHLMLAVAEHHVSTGDLSPERLKETLEALTTKNVLSHLGGKLPDYFSMMGDKAFPCTVSCIHSLFGTSDRLAA